MAGSGLARLVTARPEWGALVSRLPVLFIYVPVVGLSWWWSMVRLAEEPGATRRAALMGSLVLSCSSVALYYLTQTLHEEALVGGLVTGATLWTLHWTRRVAARPAFLAGLLAGTAFLCRVNSVFALLVPLAMTVDAAWLYWRREGTLRGWGGPVTAAGAGLAGPLALWLVFNQWRFGSPLASGYSILLASQHREFFTGIKVDAAWALLFGPGKGLFLLSPVLFFALVRLLAQGGRCRVFRVASAVALVGSAIFHSALLRGGADGSVSWGPRYQVHLVGLLLLPMLFGIEWARRRQMRPFIVVAVVAGTTIQGLGCMAPESLEYFQLQARKGRYTDEPLMGVGEGQFLARLSNTLEWAQRRSLPVAPGGSEGVAGAIERMETAYMPNVWGPVYAKRLAHGAMRGVLLVAWSLSLLVAIGSLSSAAWLLTQGARTPGAPLPRAS